MNGALLSACSMLEIMIMNLSRQLDKQISRHLCGKRAAGANLSIMINDDPK